MARRWAGGRGGSTRPEDAGDPYTAAALRARGAAMGDDGTIEVGASDADAVQLFFALGTQWRRAGLTGIRTGLDYAVVEPTARGLGLAFAPVLFADVMLMEREALKEFAKA